MSMAGPMAEYEPASWRKNAGPPPASLKNPTEAWRGSAAADELAVASAAARARAIMQTPYRLKAQSPRSMQQPIVVASRLRQHHHRGRWRRHVGHGHERDLLVHRRLEQELVQDVSLV